MKLLKFTTFSQLALVGLWVLFVLTTPENLNSLVFMFLLLPVCGVCYLVALWHLVRVPRPWPLAALTFATPIAGYTVVATANALFGLPVVSLVNLLLTALGGIAAAFLLAPHKVALLLPSVLADSRIFNRGLLLFLLLVIFGWIGSVVWFGLPEGTLSIAGTKDSAIFFWIGIWFVSLAAGPSLLYAYLGLFRRGAQRLLHAGQLVASLLVIAILIPATWLAAVVTTPLG